MSLVTVIRLGFCIEVCTCARTRFPEIIEMATARCTCDFRVTRKMEEGGILAATSFPGIPLDFQVTEAERKLRAALLLDGYSGQEGYQLARYNDPFTLPFLRRNEVLIAVEDFELN